MEEEVRKALEAAALEAGLGKSKSPSKVNWDEIWPQENVSPSPVIGESHDQGAFNPYSGLDESQKHEIAGVAPSPIAPSVDEAPSITDVKKEELPNPINTEHNPNPGFEESQKEMADNLNRSVLPDISKIKSTEAVVEEMKIYPRDSIGKSSGMTIASDQVVDWLNEFSASHYETPFSSASNAQKVDALNAFSERYMTENERNESVEKQGLSDESGKLESATASLIKGIKQVYDDASEGLYPTGLKKAQMGIGAGLAKAAADEDVSAGSVIDGISDSDVDKMTAEHIVKLRSERDEEFANSLPVKENPNLTGAAKFLLKEIPNAAGSMLGLVAIGGGNPIGIAAAGAASNAGSQFQSTLRDGGTLDQADQAKARGSVVGASEGVLGGAIGRFGKLIKSGTKIGRSRIAGEALQEGTQEAMVDVLNNMSLKDILNDGRDIFTSDVMKSFVLGSVMGGGMAGGTNLVVETRKALGAYSKALQNKISTEEPGEQTDNAKKELIKVEAILEASPPIEEAIAESKPEENTPKETKEVVSEENDTPSVAPETVDVPESTKKEEIKEDPAPSGLVKVLNENDYKVGDDGSIVIDISGMNSSEIDTEINILKDIISKDKSSDKDTRSAVSRKIKELEDSKNQDWKDTDENGDKFSRGGIEFRASRDEDGNPTRIIRYTKSGKPTHQLMPDESGNWVRYNMDGTINEKRKGKGPTDHEVYAIRYNPVKKSDVGRPPIEERVLSEIGVPMTKGGRGKGWGLDISSINTKEAADAAVKSIDQFIETNLEELNTDGSKVLALEKAAETLSSMSFDKKEDLAEDPAPSESFGQSVKALRRLRIPQKDIDKIRDAVITGEVNDESDKAVDKHFLKKNGYELGKPNTLISEYFKMKKTSDNGDAKAKKMIQAQSKTKQSSESNKKISDFWKAQKSSYSGTGAKTALKSFRKKVKAMGPDASAEKVVKAWEESLNPDQKKAYEDRKKELSKSIPGDIQSSQKGMDKEDYVAAAASQIFNKKTYKSGKHTGEYALKSDKWDVKHVAIREFDKMTDIDTLDGDVFGAFETLAGFDPLMEEVGSDADYAERRTLASQAFLGGVISYLQPLVPNMKFVYSDQPGFDAAASRIGRDPNSIRGFYHDGAIYINPKLATENTAIHEFVHAWLAMAQDSQPVLYNQMWKSAVKEGKIDQEKVDALAEKIGQDRAKIEYLTQAMDVQLTRMFKEDQAKSPMRKAYDKILRWVGVQFGLKKTDNLATMDFNQFINLVGREIFSKAQLAVVNDLGLPEFMSLNLRRTKLKNDQAIDYVNEVERNQAKEILGKTDSKYRDIARDFRMIIQDKRLVLSKVQKAINEKGLAAIDPSLDIYAQMDLSTGKVAHDVGRVAEAIYGYSDAKRHLNRKKARENSLMGRLAKEGVLWEDFSKYLYAKHAIERHDTLVERHISEMSEKGASESDIDAKRAEMASMALTGMTKKMAATIVSRVESGDKGDLYTDYAEEFRSVAIDPIKDMLSSSGMISEDLSDILDNQYQNYVPMLVDGYYDKKGRPLQKVGSVKNGVKGTGIKTAKGDFGQRFKYTQRVDPIVASVNQYAKLRAKVEENRVLQNLARLVGEVKNDALWEVVSPDYVPRLDKDGNIDSVFEIPNKPDNAIPFRQDGKLKYVIIYDKGLLRAFQKGSKSDSVFLKNVIQFIRFFQNMRRMVNTTLSASFAPAAFVADVLTAMTFVDAVIPGVKNPKVALAKNIAKAMPSIFNKEIGKDGDPDNEVRKHLMDWLENGGKISWSDYGKMDTEMVDAIKKSKRVKSAIQKKHGVATDKSIGAANLVFKTLELSASTLEQTVRLATYITAVEGGMSKQEAASASKNITVNFNRKGTATPFVNMLYLFSNAGIQGTHMLFHYSKHKKVQRNLLGLAGIGFLMSAINDLMGEEDEAFNLIGSEEQYNQAYIRIPGDKAVKIRLGYGMNIPYVTGQQIYNMMSGKTSPEVGISNAFKNFINTISPTESARGPVYAALPDVLRLAYEFKVNEGFGNIPIKKEGFNGKELRPSQAHFKSVNSVTKGFTDYMAEMTMVDGVDPKDEDIWSRYERLLGDGANPEYMDHMLGWIGGGFYRSSANIAETIMGSWSEDGINPNKIPIFRRFYEDLTKMDFRANKVFRGLVEESGKRKFTDKEMDKLKYTYVSLMSDKDTRRGRKQLKKMYIDALKLQAKRGNIKGKSR